MIDRVIPNLISTIIPVFNRADMLIEATHSVLAQSYRPIEVVISDDGSTDDTIEAAKQLVRDYPDVVRLVQNPNRGPGPARESGRLLARGEFIQYLDSDDRLLPEKFELQRAVLDANPQCGIAYGMTRLVDSEGAELKAPFKWTGEDRSTLFPGLLIDRWWCTHTPLYRRNVVDAIGPWSALRYSQDWEYDARAGGLGVQVVSCQEYVSEHRHHSGSRQTGSARWLAPCDRVSFFSALYSHSCSAGVGTSAPEMKHFARWVFRHARECAVLGDEHAAADLCALTVRAQGSDSFELRAYRFLAALAGWKRASQWSEQLRRLAGRPAGPETSRQAWMNPKT